MIEAPIAADVAADNPWGALAAIGSAFLAALGITLSTVLKRPAPKRVERRRKADKELAEVQRQLARVARDVAYLRGSTDARLGELQRKVEEVQHEAAEAHRVAAAHRDRLDGAHH